MERENKEGAVKEISLSSMLLRCSFQNGNTKSILYFTNALRLPCFEFSIFSSVTALKDVHKQ